MVLNDRSFPDKLAEDCKRASGCVHLTKAVVTLLMAYFDLRSKFKQQEHELKVVREKLFRLQRAVEARKLAEDSIEAALSFSKSDDGFFLEADERPASSFPKGGRL